MIQPLVAGQFRQRRTKQVRIAHEAVGILMVFIRANAIESELGRQHEFVQRPIVIVGHFIGVPVFPPRRIDPR
jgi:hypothetical protein